MGAPAERLPAADGPPRLADLTAALWRHGCDLAADYALLAVLDARAAAVRFGWVIAAGLVAAVLVSTAWLALVVAGVVAMTGNGASWGAALGAAGAANVLAAAGIGFWIRARIRELPFTATLRQLRGERPGRAENANAP